MTQIKITANKQNIDKAIAQIEKEIKHRKIADAHIGSFLLYSEEILLQLIANSEKENNKINIKISGKKNNVKAKFSSKGKELYLDETFIAKELFDKAKLDEEQALVISKMILKGNTDRVNFHYKRGINYAQVNSAAKVQKTAGLLGWMFGGIILGLILKLIGISSITNVSSELFSVVSTLFMNAIKMLVTPLVFFSIADSVSDFSDVGTFGRIGVKIVLTYIIFSFIAIFITAGVFFIVKPGDASLAPELLALAGNSETVQTTSVSLKSTLIDIVPSGFITAFVDQNMTQMIFLAILVGLTAAKLGEYSEKVQSFLAAGNALFSQLIATVIKTLKPVCLCMMANVTLSLTASSFIQQFKAIVSLFVAIIILIILYALYVSVVGKQNPLVFASKIKKAFFVAFSTMSSSATIPTTMQSCDDLGVDPKVYSFSIPLGATINMNGSCMFYMLSTLFIAKILGIPMTMTKLISIAFTTLLLAISAPGIPGAALACISVLFASAGIPAGAVSYIIGIYTITDGLLTAVNITGDAVATYVVSKSEKMLKKKS